MRRKFTWQSPFPRIPRIHRIPRAWTTKFEKRRKCGCLRIPLRPYLCIWSHIYVAAKCGPRRFKQFRNQDVLWPSINLLEASTNLFNSSQCRVWRNFWLLARPGTDLQTKVSPLGMLGEPRSSSLSQLTRE